MTSPRLRRLSLPGLLAVPLIALIVAACGTSGAAILSTVGSSVSGGDNRAAQVPAAQPGSLSASGGSGSDSQQYDPQDPNLLIIKTGQLDLQVRDLEASLAAASQKISALGGYVSGSQRQGDTEQATASVTYRIPAAHWDEALVALRGLASKVLGEQSQTQDVTGQVVDLGARITNLQATERALQGIMSQATKIADVLAVQAQLTDVRGQIEQLTAERKHLQEQAAFSTLTVNFGLKEQAVLATSKKFDPTSEVDRASASLVDLIQSVATAGIWIGIVWLPILIVLLVLALIVRFVLRRTFWAAPRGSAGGGPAAGEITAPPAES